MPITSFVFASYSFPYSDAFFSISQRANVDFFVGEPLGALKTLAYSENLDLQRSAGLALAEVTDPSKFVLRFLFFVIFVPLSNTPSLLILDPGVASREGLQLIISLLKSPDTEVQRSASAALGNLASNSVYHLVLLLPNVILTFINQTLTNYLSSRPMAFNHSSIS